MTHAKGRLVASQTASDDGHRPVMGRIAVVVIVTFFVSRRVWRLEDSLNACDVK
jgi:hypothetical protein